MMKYLVTVSCPAFEDIEVEADTIEEAINEAERQYKLSWRRWKIERSKGKAYLTGNM